MEPKVVEMGTFKTNLEEREILSIERDKLKKECDDLKESLSQTIEQSREYQLAAEKAKNECDSLVTDLQVMHKEVVDNLEKEKTELQKRVEALQTEIAERIQSSEQLMNEKESFSALLNSEREKLEESIEENVEAETKQRVLNNQYDSANKMIESMKENIKSLSETIQHLEATKDFLEDEKLTLANQLNEATIQLYNLETELLAMKSLFSSTEHELSVLQSKQSEVHIMMQTLCATLKSSQEAVSVTSSGFETVASNHDDFYQPILHAHDVELDLKCLISELESGFKIVRQENEASKNTLSILQGKYDQMNALMSVTKEEYEKEKGDWATMRDSLSAERDAIHIALTKSIQSVNDLEKSYSLAFEETFSLKAAINEFESEIQKLKAMLESSESENYEIKQTLEQLENENKILISSQCELQNLVKDYDCLKTQVQTLVTEKEELRTTLQAADKCFEMSQIKIDELV
ncbi:hypothetical protein BJ742DRAFT_329224 [Cladochytrium replicatum]|nr:hypothetical protein BJ742DRAFT_329224 [Cladochytrium replicatum]